MMEGTDETKRRDVFFLSVTFTSRIAKSGFTICISILHANGVVVSMSYRQ